MNKIRCVILFLASLCAMPSPAQDRLWVDARINGKPVRLFFDTATTHAVLFQKTADRLGLKYELPSGDGAPPPAGFIAAATSEECEFSIVGSPSIRRMQFRIYDPPDYMHSDADGVLGWGGSRNSIFWIDAANDGLATLPDVPPKAREWKQFRLQPDRGILTLEFAENKCTKTIVLDTGLEEGVVLAPDKWREWKAAHPGQRVTLNAGFMPAVGVVVTEAAWADTIAVGPLILTNVPVSEADPVHAAALSFDAALGMEAMKQLQLVIDGKEDTAYVNVIHQVPTPRNHNRLGAVFVPNDPRKDNDLIAHVAAGSPAQKAGIQDGDVLLRVGDMDVTRWRSNPDIMPLSRFWERPKGTELRLSLRQGQHTNEVSVTLEDIIGPAPSPAQ